MIKLEEVGNKIAELRHNNNLKQKDIAKILNVNDIPLEKINILANFYNVFINYIVGRTNNKKTYQKNMSKNQKNNI